MSDISDGFSHWPFSQLRQHGFYTWQERECINRLLLTKAYPGGYDTGFYDSAPPNDRASVSTIVKEFLEARLEALARGSENEARTLVSTASRQLNSVLTESGNVQDDVGIITSNLPFNLIRELIEDGSMTYYVSRKVLQAKPTLYDVDETILLNLVYIRHKIDHGNRDDSFLVTLSQLADILDPTPTPSGTLKFSRKDPPLGGFEFLDYDRERSMSIVSEDLLYQKNFEILTGGILNGLEWDNVLVAGEIALVTLIHPNPSQEDDPRNYNPAELDDCSSSEWNSVHESPRRVRDCHIDMFLYGLTAERANAKVMHLWDIWKANLPSTNTETLVVKSADSIIFIPSYPNRRLRIQLKLYQSPTHILLDVDLDAYAIGFNGLQPLMLSNCARAIETGYTIFTMDLISGHKLRDANGGDPALLRIFNYAELGFGLRILPSWIRSLDEHKMIPNTENDTDSQTQLSDTSTWHNPSDAESQIPPFSGREQHKSGSGLAKLEPGLKALRRRAYRVAKSRVYPYCDPMKVETPLFWTNRNPMALDLAISPFSMSFEAFMTECKAWTRLRLGKYTDSPYPCRSPDSRGFSDYGFEYRWWPACSTDHIITLLEDADNALFDNSLKTIISAHLGLPYHFSGYNNYLTRRMRRLVWGPDLDAVMKKQITLPVLLPHDLETFMNNMLADLPHLPRHFTAKPMIIPLYNASVHSTPNADPAAQPALPPMLDNATAEGNLRYWVITNRSMWAGQHQMVDEMFEVYNTAFHILRFIGQDMRTYQTFAQHHLDQDAASWYFGRVFRCRALPPSTYMDAATQPGRDVPFHKVRLTRLSEWEKLRFHTWIFQSRKTQPDSLYDIKDEENDGNIIGDGTDHATVPSASVEPFWKSCDEEQWYGETVLAWRDMKPSDSAQSRWIDLDEWQYQIQWLYGRQVAEPSEGSDRL